MVALSEKEKKKKTSNAAFVCVFVEKVFELVVVADQNVYTQMNRDEPKPEKEEEEREKKLKPNSTKTDRIMDKTQM